jgi:hypothetical protein
MNIHNSVFLACTFGAALATAGAALAQPSYGPSAPPTPPSPSTTTAPPPTAPSPAAGMVTVDLTGTKPQIAQSTGMAAATIPDTVQIPPSYAARLCDGTPAAGGTCKATKNDESFNAALKSQLSKAPG